MQFWIFMLIMDLLMPLTMIFFGFIFKNPPKKINGYYGYRTKMSMKNTDTWEFAHRTLSKRWRGAGLVMLPVSIAAMLCVIGQNESVVSLFGGALCAGQLIVSVVPIIKTEKDLKTTFDKDGNRKDK